MADIIKLRLTIVKDINEDALIGEGGQVVDYANPEKIKSIRTRTI